MPDDRRIRDILRTGSLDDVDRAIGEIAESGRRSLEWLATNRSRTNESVAWTNLLATLVTFLEIAKLRGGDAVQVLALCTRGVYELDLRVRHILQSPENLQRWLSEAAFDRIQVLEAVLVLRSPETELAAATIEEEIQRIRALVKKHALPEPKKAPTTSDLATEAGVDSDYRAFFKLFSKLVHPSSFLVNSADQANDSVTRTILLINLQLYAVDMISRLQDAMGMPRTTMDSVN